MSFKKILTIFLTAALLVSALTVSVSAENTETFKVGVEAMTAASTVSASPIIYNQGDAVTVVIRASQNTGITSVKLLIDYDENVLTPVEGSYKAAGLLSAGDMLTGKVSSEGDGYFIFYSDSYPAVRDSVGILGQITFVAKDTCAVDTSITVKPFSNGSCVKNTVSGIVAVPFTQEVDTFSVHKIDKTAGVVTDPTCTAQGYTTYSCLSCNEAVVGNITPANGHDPAEAVEENRVEATCTADGKYDSVVYCKTGSCKAELSRETVTIPMKGHDPAGAVEENRVEATCTADGKYDSVVYCKTGSCKAELSRETVTIPMKGHEPAGAVEENRVEATCTADGKYDSVVYCKTGSCKAELSRETVTIPMKGHEPAEAVEENRIEPTALVVGSYDSVVCCKICNAEISRETVALPCIIPADGWYQEDGKWYFFADGQMIKNAWRKDSIGWCYLGADGAMVTNAWQCDSVGWCYLGEDGHCVKNTWKRDSVGWCYLGEDGYCVKNTWKKDSVGWCYLDSEGRMVYNKWVKDSIGWCYVGADGYMVYSKWVKDSVDWCYIGSDGYLLTNGWAQDSVGWYWMGNDGYAIKNTSKTVDGKTYSFDASGLCTNP